MKNIILTACIILSQFTLESQNIVVKKSKPIEGLKKGGYYTDFLLYHDSNYYFKFVDHVMLENRMSIHKFDKNLNNIYQRKITTDEKDIKYLDLFGMKNFIYLLSYRDNKKTHNFEIYLTKLDTEAKQAGHVKLVDIHVKSKKQQPDLQWSFSPDSLKFVMVSYPSDRDNVNTPVEFYYKVVDTELKNVFEKKVKLPYNFKEFNAQKVLVDNLGIVYILGKIIKTPDKNNLVIIRCDPSGYNEIPIPIKMPFIHSQDFCINTKGVISIGGYVDSKASNIATGMFLTNYDCNSKTIIFSTNIPIASEIISKLKNTDVLKKEHGQEGIDVKFAAVTIYNEDENYIFISHEKLYVITRGYGANATYINRSEDRVTSYIRRDGSLDNILVFPKNTFTGHYHDDSHFFFSKDKMFYLYNEEYDHRDKLDRKGGEILFGSANIPLLGMQNMDGTVKKFPLLEKEDYFNNTAVGFVQKNKIVFAAYNSSGFASIPKNNRIITIQLP